MSHVTDLLAHLTLFPRIILYTLYMGLTVYMGITVYVGLTVYMGLTLYVGFTLSEALFYVGASSLFVYYCFFQYLLGASGGVAPSGVGCLS